MRYQRPFRLLKHIGLYSICLMLLSGCLDEDITLRHDAPPTLMPTGITFKDRDPTNKLGGYIYLESAIENLGPDESSSIDYYEVHWAVDGIKYQQGFGTSPSLIGRVHRNADPLRVEVKYKPPNGGANSFIAYTANSRGHAAEGISYTFTNAYSNPLAPKISSGDPDNPRYDDFKVRGVSFSDSTSNVGVKGRVRWYEPINGEDDITHYVIRFADQDGCPMDEKIDEVPKSSGEYKINKAIYPPSGAKSILVIRKNQYGEAWRVDCEGESGYAASDESYFNTIDVTYSSFFKVERVQFSTDNDSTETYGGTMTIYPVPDDRDVYETTHNDKVCSYFVNIIPQSSSVEPGPWDYDVCFPKSSQPMTYTLSKHQMKYNMIRVSVGAPWADEDQYSEWKVGDTQTNVVGNWYTIKNKKTGYCMQVGDNTSDVLTVEPCDEYNVAQRFNPSWVAAPTHVRSTQEIQDDDWLTQAEKNREIDDNDDYYLIESEKHKGYYTYRQATAAGYWSLTTDKDDWRAEIQLRSQFVTELDANWEWKKMAVVNYVWPAFNFACFSTWWNNDTDDDGVYGDDARSAWGNCTGVYDTEVIIGGGLITNHIQWKFTRADGHVNTFKDNKRWD